MAYNASGGFGGGYHMTDGTSELGIWSNFGNMQFGFGTSGGAITSKSALSTTGVWTATDF